MIAWLRTVSEPSERPVLLETPHGWMQLRLLAAPIPAEKAEATRRRVRQRYQRKQIAVSQDTLWRPDLSSADQSAGRSLNHPTGLFPTKSVGKSNSSSNVSKDCFISVTYGLKIPELAQTYLLAKLLIALILDQMTHQVALQQPEWFVSLDHPLNPSRLTMWFYETFRQMIFGLGFAQNLHLYLIVMRRYFCDPPRSRPQQFWTTNYTIIKIH